MFKTVNDAALLFIPTYKELFEQESLRRSKSDFELDEWERARIHLRESKLDAFMGAMTLMLGSYLALSEFAGTISIPLPILIPLAAGCIIIGVIDITVASYEAARAIEIKQEIIQWRHGAHIAQKMVKQAPYLKSGEITVSLWFQALKQVLFKKPCAKTMQSIIDN